MKYRKRAIISIVFVIIVVAVFILKESPSQTENVRSKEAILKQLQLYEPFYLSEVEESYYIKYADELIEGNLIVNEKINEQVKYDALDIDWNMKATASPNTFSLYLQSLRPVYYLSKAYVVTGEVKYIRVADEIVSSWNDYLNYRNLNRYTWYDHSVSERVENLIYYSIIKRSLEDDGRFIDITTELIKRDSAWLYEDKNYTPRHNHGIFEDGALIKAGYFLDEESYRKKGTKRLDEQLSYAFPNKYIHVENSVGYHIGIINYIKGVSEFLNKFNDEYAQISSAYYKGAIDYLVYVYKPNQSFPFIGDTIGSSGNGVITMNIEDDFLKYVQTKGRSGRVPSEKTRVYMNDGIAIFREHWNPDGYQDSSWLLFKSGFLSSTHKHADDLSFLLYSKGHDIFVDPGMYNYMVGNKLHDYMNGNLAHNTIVVDDKSYSVSMFNSNKVGLHSYRKNEGYESIIGYNNIFPGVFIDRTIHYIDGNNFLIYDDILSDKAHKYSQVFHLSNDVEIIKQNNKYTILKIKNTNYFILMHQLLESDTFRLDKGNSYISDGLNKVVPSRTLVFEKNNFSTQFITYISIVKERDLNEIIKDPPKVENNLVDIYGTKISLSSRERLPETDIITAIQGNEFQITNKAKSATQVLSYSYYLLDKDTGKKYASSSYSHDNKAEFTLEKGKSYAVVSYLRNNAKETSKKLVGFIDYSEGGFTYNNIPALEQEPIITRASLQKKTDRHYKFDVDISNLHGMTSKWYIYKDGASYDFVGNTSNTLEYEFTDPGTYTCIYRISDRYFGEVVYDNFKEIIIK